MVILKSMESILSIIIMIIIGCILSKKGWFDEKSTSLISNLVCKVALPAYMIANLVTSFTRDKLYQMSGGLIVPFTSIFVCYLIAILVSKILNIDEKRKGTFQSMFFVSNTIFIGLPVNLALFGENSVPYVLLYYIANTTFFWTIGVYCISKDGDEKNRKILSKKTLKKILSPPLLGFLVGIVIILLEIPMPNFVISTCKYLGNLTTPLSMIFIGITVSKIKFKEIKFSKDMLALIIGRFIVCPIVVIVMVLFIDMPQMMKQVFIIQSSMPIMTQTSIIAKQYNADYEYAAVMTTITTLLAAVSIPVYMLLLSKIKIFL